jgi:GNAT superfamily N-acetyltransferase
MLGGKMIRPAVSDDIEKIAQTYDELLQWEQENGSTTNWVSGLYPTRKVPEDKIPVGEMFVLEENGDICASMVLNHDQLPEYADIEWLYPAENNECLVIHTLCIPPSKAHRGYGKKMVQFAFDYAKTHGCKVIRIDTYENNEPAKSLYQKLGFRIAGYGECLFQGLIPEKLAYLEYLL